jgi:hypothetical protein
MPDEVTDNENNQTYSVSIPGPLVDLNHPRQEMVFIDKKDLKHYVDLVEHISKKHFNLSALFWFIFTFSLGNLVTMWINNIPYQDHYLIWYFLWFCLLSIGLVGGILLIFTKTNDNGVLSLAKESNETYKKKLIKEK